ncbi:glycosyltransferase involved in cell wall biosynthesis [Paenarthrobacter nicotinovorans]|uniref:glycosyltransferase n=1 Tax=Paenarthrobacter nicotinovorans TaxID=29320 RepID=UPI00277DD6FD|nr:glycosyltransferase [Paenarthrobacter nicotinovorans]MDP9936318.1 glycosyltransferase involved in cell wall biosynthesis [Paenarthrobacter nicotinovorans]
MTSIVIIQPHLRFGGAERQTVLLANELVARGVTCHVILHEAKGGLISELDAGVQVHDLGLYSHLRSFETSKRLSKVLASIEPSFVIVKLWSSILATAWAEKDNPHHTYNYCEDLDPSDHAEFIRFGAFKQRLVGRIFKSRKLLSANTHTVAESMRKEYKLSSEIAVISSVVEPKLVRELADQDAARFDSDRLNVISVGSLIHRKGLVSTLAGLRRLDKPVRWHVVGEGPLQELLETEEKSQDNVEIVLHGGTANPYGLMKAADVMVHGAVSEAFGIVLLESMAVGTPVLAADSIGPSEMQSVLGHQPEFLQLFPKGDAEALANELNRQVSERATWNVDASEYIAPYVLDSTVRAWINRASEYGPK